MSTPALPFPRFLPGMPPLRAGRKEAICESNRKTRRSSCARRIIVGGVALAAVLFVLLRPEYRQPLSTEESAPHARDRRDPRSEAEDAQGELNWQYPPAGSIIPIFRIRKRSATRNSPAFPTGGICS